MTTTTGRPPATAARTRRWQFRIFAITWAAYAAFYFTRQAFSVAQVGILDDPTVNTTLTKHVLGDLDATYLAAYAVGQFVWGSLADRWGPRIVVIGGLAMSAVAAAFMGLVPALVLFAPLMVVQGLAQSTGWASLCKNVSAFFPSAQRGRMLGLWSTNYAFGGLAAAPFAGWVAYTIWADWRVAFLAGAAVVLVVLAAFVVFQRNHPDQVGLGSYDDATATGRRLPLRDALLTGVRDRTVLTLGLSYFLLKPARYAILLWGPVIVTERIPTAGKFEAVVIPVAFGAAGLVAPIVIGYVSDKVFGARRIPPCVLSLGALVVALALFIPLTASGSVPLTMLVLGVIGFTAYAADAMISCVSAVDFGTSARAGAAAGFVNGCGSVGAILGGLLPGYLGGTGLFLGFAAAALLAGLILLPRWNQRPTA